MLRSEKMVHGTISMIHGENDYATVRKIGLDSSFHVLIILFSVKK